MEFYFATFSSFFPAFFFLFFFVSRKFACRACNGTSNNLISLPVGEILRSRGGVEETLFKTSLSFSGAKSKGLTHLLLQSFVAYFHIRVHTMHIHTYLARSTICVSRVIFHSGLSHLFIPNLS